MVNIYGKVVYTLIVKVEWNSCESEIRFRHLRFARFLVNNGESDGERCQECARDKSPISDREDHPVPYLRFKVLEGAMFRIDCR